MLSALFAFLSVFPASVTAQSFSTVDWSVSKVEDATLGRQECRIRWLFDDNLQLLFLLRKGKTYFELQTATIEKYPEIREASYEAWLNLVDGRSIRLQAQGVPPDSLIMLMEASNIDALSLQTSENILLNWSGAPFTLPLANARENFRVFRECLTSIYGYDPIYEEAPPADAPMDAPSAEGTNQPGLDDENVLLTQDATVPRTSLWDAIHRTQDSDNQTLQIGNADGGELLTVSGMERRSFEEDIDSGQSAPDATQPLPSPLPPPVDGRFTPRAVEPAAGEMDESDTPRVEGKASSQVDAILNEATYLGEEERDAGKETCLSPDVQTFNEQNNPLVRNLTRKLQMLEHEKEELRKKLLTLEDGGMVADLVACEPSFPGQNTEELNENIIAQFETLVKQLRMENELLRESLLEADNVERSVAAMENEIQELRQQASELSRRSSEVREELEACQNNLVSHPVLDVDVRDRENKAVSPERDGNAVSDTDYPDEVTNEGSVEGEKSHEGG